MNKVKIHKTATVEKTAIIGGGTYIWHYVHVREGAVIGTNCIIGHCAHVGKDVKVGSNVKMGNNVSLFEGVTVEDNVLVGPHVVITNDLRPRSIGEWHVIKTFVRKGASIGANSTVICGVEIGEHSMVGAGSVVTRSVPPYALVYGNPAKLRGFVCECGEKLGGPEIAGRKSAKCGKCSRRYGSRGGRLVEIKD
jgi:UDP-2-acetamido-3-amino-2,3-dideoxy-glucuronate N-acetyltransferase